MLDESVAGRYAQALFGLAHDLGQADEVGRELEQVQRMFGREPSLSRAMRSPNVPEAVKKAIVHETFGRQLSPLMVKFLMVLVERQREGVLDAISTRYHEMLQEGRGEVSARVETAVELSPEVQRAVEASLSAHTGRKAVLDWHTNPDILGGIVVRIKDHLIDYSLRKQLHDLRDRLLRT